MASEDSKPAQAAATAEPTSPATAAAGEAPPNPTAAQNPSAAAAATDLEKKMRRAERFGTQVVMSEDEKRSSRAER
jgi:SAP domain-containing ribonucleoprotein